MNSTGTPLIADQRCATSASAVRQRDALESLRPRRLDRAARLGQALARQAHGVVDVPLPVVAPIARLLGRLQLGDDPGQALGDRVVDLARHPRPLVEHAGLAGLRDELRWSPTFSSMATSSWATAWRRCSLSSDSRSPKTVPNPIATVWMTMIAP